MVGRKQRERPVIAERQHDRKASRRRGTQVDRVKQETAGAAFRESRRRGLSSGLTEASSIPAHRGPAELNCDTAEESRTLCHALAGDVRGIGLSRTGRRPGAADSDRAQVPSVRRRHGGRPGPGRPSGEPGVVGLRALPRGGPLRARRADDGEAGAFSDAKVRAQLLAACEYETSMTSLANLISSQSEAAADELRRDLREINGEP